MSYSVTPAVVALKTLTFLLGGTITFYAFKAYRRTASAALRALTIGFGVIAFGALVAGIVDQLLPLAASVALVVESLFTAVGFAIVLYSLYVE